MVLTSVQWLPHSYKTKSQQKALHASRKRLNNRIIAGWSWEENHFHKLCTIAVRRSQGNRLRPAVNPVKCKPGDSDHYEAEHAPFWPDGASAEPTWAMQ